MLPLKDLNIKPGLYTIGTDRGAGVLGRWKDGDKVRFHNGAPQKIGGWVRSGTVAFAGRVRGITDWQTLSFEKFIGAGTNLKLQLWKGGTIFDITPIRASGTLGSDPFTTTSGSAVVNVEHTSHGVTAGDYVHFDDASAVGGITIDGEYTVDSVVDSDNFTITHSAAATSAASGGGNSVTYEYEIHIGAESSTYGLGWGAGGWSESTWGTARTISNFLTAARTWSLDQWGEDLIACPRGGGIYVWDASVGTGTRAAVISGAPTTARFVMVSPVAQHLIAFGAHSGSADDPLLIRWSTNEDYTSWTPSASNSAGTKRLNTGNEIFCGVEANKEILVFTDSHLWRMAYIGPPEVFAFDPLGQHGGIRGPNAAIEVNGIVYWMGEKNFYYFDGSIRELECDVWPTVFKNINPIQRHKVFAGYNRGFGEIWWLYCSADSEDVDRYVIYNVQERVWSFGTLSRTVFVGDSDIFSNPYAIDPDGKLYDHEFGTDDDGDAMTVTLESGDVEIGEGDDMMHVGMLVPDFKDLTGSVSLSLTAKKWPHSGAGKTSTKGPFAITSATEYINPRIRGRQLSLSLSSSAVGDHWRLGTIRLGVRAHGKR